MTRLNVSVIKRLADADLETICYAERKFCGTDRHTAVLCKAASLANAELARREAARFEHGRSNLLALCR